jgi:hypothetical protein
LGCRSISRALHPVDGDRFGLVVWLIVKGESPLWGVLMSAVGASFVVVAVALGIVSKGAADEAGPEASATAMPDNALIQAAPTAAGSTPPAALTDGGAPADASIAPEISADAGPDGSADAASPEPSAAAVTAPPKPKSPLPAKKTPVRPKPKKPR